MTRCPIASALSLNGYAVGGEGVNAVGVEYISWDGV